MIITVLAIVGLYAVARVCFPVQTVAIQTAVWAKVTSLFKKSS